MIQAVGGAVFTLLLTIFFVGWPVRRTFDSVSAREMLGVGREILGAELLTRYNKESPKIFIGLFMGVDALGIFAMAMRFVSLLHQLVGGTLHKVTLPVFSQVNRASPDRMSEVYLRLIRLGAAVIFPSYFLIIVMADPLVAVLLGPNWADIVPVIGVLVLGAMLINFGALDSSTLVSMGNTKSPFLYSLIRAIFGSLLMITAAPFGVVAIGVAYCLRGVFVEPFQNNRLLQLLNVPLAVYLKQLWRSFLSALAMAAIGTCLLSVFDGKHEVLVLGLSMTIALAGLCGLFVYL